MSEHEGLPVAGYRAQSDTAVRLVNANKEIEERVLRLLDGYADTDVIDKRWLAVGRTQIEQGFMAVNRAIFRPERAALAEREHPVEGGWLIEEASSSPAQPVYFTAGPTGPAFGTSHEKALRFARKDDAEAFVIMSQGSLAGVRIAWHEWG